MLVPNNDDRVAVCPHIDAPTAVNGAYYENRLSFKGESIHWFGCCDQCFQSIGHDVNLIWSTCDHIGIWIGMEKLN